MNMLPGTETLLQPWTLGEILAALAMLAAIIAAIANVATVPEDGSRRFLTITFFLGSLVLAGVVVAGRTVRHEALVQLAKERMEGEARMQEVAEEEARRRLRVEIKLINRTVEEAEQRLLLTSRETLDKALKQLLAAGLQESNSEISFGELIAQGRAASEERALKYLEGKWRYWSGAKPDPKLPSTQHCSVEFTDGRVMIHSLMTPLWTWHPSLRVLFRIESVSGRQIYIETSGISNSLGEEYFKHLRLTLDTENDHLIILDRKLNSAQICERVPS